MPRKPRALPYVYIDVDAKTDGTNTPVAIHANCSIYLPQWPTKCPYFRSYTDPPGEGDYCVWYDGGDCRCRELFRDGMRLFREFIDEHLPLLENPS